MTSPGNSSPPPLLPSPASTSPALSTSDPHSHDAEPQSEDALEDGKKSALTRRFSEVSIQSDPREFFTGAPTDFVTIPTADDALAFLFNTVISFSESHRDTARGWHAEVRDIWRESPDNSLIRTAAQATSLALLGAGRQNRRLLKDGIVIHGDALTQLRDALMDPVASRSDATLLSVLMLAHFDFIVSARENRPYLDAHGRILPALLAHRGMDQLKDPRSRRLFYNIQLQVVNSRIYGSSHFQEPDEILLLDDDSDHPGARLNNTLKALLRFQNRVGVVKTRPTNINQSRLDVQKALEEATRIDNNLVDWASSLRSNWQFTIINPAQTKLRPSQYWKSVHRYPDLWICRIWNSFRIARIELHASTWNLMIWSSAHHGTDHTERQLHSQRIIQRMVDDVAASFPYGIGDLPDHADKSRAPHPPGRINYNAHAASMGWFLLNPVLRVCLKAPHVPEDERQWLTAQLIRCCKFGMAQAGSNNFDFLLREKQPIFAYSMPIVTLSDSQASDHHLREPGPSDSAVIESDNEDSPPPPSRDSPAMSPRSSPAKPALTVEDSAENDEVRPFGSSLDLKFINTTRPGQTKDEGVQKKIRRDVMLDYHRKNTRRKQAERLQTQASARQQQPTPSSSRQPS